MSTHPFRLPSPGSLSDEDELKSLQDVNSRINTAIPLLFKQRAIASSRVNALQSATRALPPETLSIIFEHACALARIQLSPVISLRNRPHPHHFLLAISGVSSLWRQIILSSPRLWAHICIRFNGKPAEGSLNLLRMYLAKSGSVELDLELYFHSISGTSYPVLMQTSKPWPHFESLVDISVDSIILDNLHRVRSLHLQAASVKWLSYAPQLRNLTRFTFSSNRPKVNPNMSAHAAAIMVHDGSPNDYTLASFTNSPHLHKLSLAGGTFVELGAGTHWSTITILEFSFVEKSTCLGLLALCTHIEEYTCKFSRNDSSFNYNQLAGKSSMATSWSSPVTRSHLRIFNWDMLRQVDDKELLMLKNLQVPAIQRLGLRIWSHSQQPHVRGFCSRLPPSITSIHLSMVCNPAEQPDACIFKSFVPTLQTEELMIGCLGCVKSANHALNWMMDPDFFPKVKRLKFYGPFPTLIPRPLPPLVLPGYCGELIVQVMRTRAIKKQNADFHFELRKISPQWTNETREQLKAVENEAGTKVHVVEDYFNLGEPHP